MSVAPRRLLAVALLALAGAPFPVAAMRRASRQDAGTAAALVERGAARPRLASRLWARAVLVLAAARGPAQAKVNMPHERFAELDQDGDRVVSLGEYLDDARALLQHQSEIAQDQIADALAAGEALFHAADVDGDGNLSLREFEYAQYLVLNGEKDEAGMIVDDAEHGGGSGQAAWETTDELDKALFLQAIQETAAEEGWGAFLTYPEIVAWLRSLFDKADLDVDGKLREREFDYAIYLMARDIDTGKFDEMVLASTLFGILDADGDGLVDVEEVASDASWSRAPPGSEENVQLNAVTDGMRALFADGDADGDGALDPRELGKLGMRLIDTM